MIQPATLCIWPQKLYLLANSIKTVITLALLLNGYIIGFNSGHIPTEIN